MKAFRLLGNGVFSCSLAKAARHKHLKFQKEIGKADEREKERERSNHCS